MNRCIFYICTWCIPIIPSPFTPPAPPIMPPSHYSSYLTFVPLRPPFDLCPTPYLNFVPLHPPHELCPITLMTFVLLHPSLELCLNYSPTITLSNHTLPWEICFIRPPLELTPIKFPLYLVNFVPLLPLPSWILFHYPPPSTYTYNITTWNLSEQAASPPLELCPNPQPTNPPPLSLIHTLEPYPIALPGVNRGHRELLYNFLGHWGSWVLGPSYKFFRPFFARRGSVGLIVPFFWLNGSYRGSYNFYDSSGLKKQLIFLAH